MISSPPGCKSQCKICSLKRARNEGGSGEVWATCRGWWPSRGPEICLSWPVIDSLLGSLKAQEVAGIISVYMWHQFVQIYIESPSALKVDYFTLLLLLFKCFFFFFWKHVRVLLKTGFPGVCFLLTRILRICRRLFKSPEFNSRGDLN